VSSVDTAAGFTYAFNCGSGYGAFSGTSTATCSTSDDGTRTVKGKIRDQDNGEIEYIATVTINNVDPVVTAAANQSSDEGESHSFSLGSFTDPGDDGDWSVDVNWGDSSAHTTFTQASPGSLGTKSHTYADGSNDYTVTVTVTEAGSGTPPSGQATFSVHVNNVAPQVAFTSAPASASEGDAKTYQFTVNDPGDDTYSAASGYPTCGSGASVVSGSFSVGGNSGSKTGSFQCDFPDGPSSPTVALRFTDSDGDSGTASQLVSVANVAPQIQGFAATGGSATACITGNTVTVSFTVFDPADQAHDPIVGTINWGDGSTTIAGRSISESHSYGAGNYSIQVAVNDGDGGADTKSQAVGLLYNMSAIQPPINADGSSIFKYGSTIPVKVRITDCSGAPVPGLAPTIGLSLANSATPPPPINEEVYSTSAADTGNTMRYDASGGQYIYNFNTKSAAITDQNATYWMTVRSAVTSPSQVASKFGVKSK
jgi:hypothetical protein